MLALKLLHDGVLRDLGCQVAQRRCIGEADFTPRMLDTPNRAQMSE
jgi:hypothetical protein